nr:hypothetical protein [Chloroflexota bacterium]
LFSIVLLGSFGDGSRTTATLYRELAARMAAVGHRLDASAGPVITNFPIWMAETQRIPALALPNEPPADVLDLAREFRGTRYLILVGADTPHYPVDLDAGVPGAECFRELELGPYAGPGPDPLDGTRAFEIGCR